jgi:hypothetical protein
VGRAVEEGRTVPSHVFHQILRKSLRRNTVGMEVLTRYA